MVVFATDSIPSSLSAKQLFALIARPITNIECANEDA
jgi:hypothetical protein